MKEKHIRNISKCPECCYSRYYTHKECGGRWHERLVDYLPDEGCIHNYKCDKCDKEDYQHGYEDYQINFDNEKTIT